MGVSRCRDDDRLVAAHRSDRPRHCWACPVPARAAPGEPSWRFLHRFATEQPCHRRYPTPRRRPRSSCSCWAWPRSAAHGRSATSSSWPRPSRAACSASGRWRSAPTAARRLPVRRARPGALRGRPAICARGCARTSVPTGSGPRSSRLRGARPNRVACARLRARGRPRGASADSRSFTPARERRARRGSDRYVYLRRRSSVVCGTEEPTEPGPPTKSRRRAQLAARALEGAEWTSPGDALPQLRQARTAGW